MTDPKLTALLGRLTEKFGEFEVVKYTGTANQEGLLIRWINEGSVNPTLKMHVFVEDGKVGVEVLPFELEDVLKLITTVVNRFTG